VIVQIRHFARVAAAVGAAVLLASGCNSASSSTTSSSGSAGGKTCNLSIAFFGALTGSAANLGVNIKDGAALAIDQYNAKHADCKVTLKPFDSEGSPDKAPGLARQLVTDKTIIGIIGPAFSGESEAADPIFDQAGIPTISPSATRPSLSTKGWKVFHRAVANDDAQGPGAANYIKNVLKPTKVFVADDQSAYGAGLAEAVTKSLGSLVAGTDKTGADGKQTDFSATVTKVKSSGATVMFYGGYYQNGGLIAKQLAAAGLKVTLVGGDGMKDPGFITAAGQQAAEGDVATCPCSPPGTAKGTFVADYKKAYNTEAGTYSDIAFDAANIFLAGVDAGNTTPDKVNSYLSTINYEGIANTYKFTSTGELDPTLIKVWAFKFTGGQVVQDQEIKATS
jgi:branched-chain amino acid transport system substrate-binding protein